MNSDTASVAFALCGTILLSLYLVHTVVCNDDFVMWLAGGDAQVGIANRVLNIRRRRRQMRDIRETMKRLCTYTQSVIIVIGLGYLMTYDEGNFSISIWELDSSFSVSWTAVAIAVFFSLSLWLESICTLTTKQFCKTTATSFEPL